MYTYNLQAIQFSNVHCSSWIARVANPVTNVTPSWIKGTEHLKLKQLDQLVSNHKVDHSDFVGEG